MATKQHSGRSRQRVAQAESSADGMVHSAQESMQQFGEQCEHTVQEHPLGSVLASFGLGLAVGAIGAALLHGSRSEPTSSSWLNGLHRQISDSVTDSLGKMFGKA